MVCINSGIEQSVFVLVFFDFLDDKPNIFSPNLHHLLVLVLGKTGIYT